MSRHRPIRIYEAKLGRQRAWGLAMPGMVIVDPRQRSRAYASTLVHEVLHTLLPNRGESFIRVAACRITRALWEAGFRRIAK